MKLVKICPKCKSMRTTKLFDKVEKRVVSKCLDCSFRGDELFAEVSVTEVSSVIHSENNLRKWNRK